MSEILEPKIKNDPLAMAIHTLVKVMQIDYASVFIKSYSTDSDKQILKRRIYKSLVGIDPKCIIDAYDKITELNPEFMPSIRQIIEESKIIDRRLKKETESLQQAESLSALPKPTIFCNPVKLLYKAKEKAEKKDKKDPKEWLKRKELARLELQAAVSVVPKKHADMDHQCAVGFCSKPGVFTRSPRGSENWYCNEHFIKE